jgi:Ca2+-binding EF-hand superfamily protein
MSDTKDYSATFALIDIDGDGLITAPELQQLMAALGGDVSDEQAAHAIGVLDTDGDGKVSLEELTAYLSDPENGGSGDLDATAAADTESESGSSAV